MTLVRAAAACLAAAVLTGCFYADDPLLARRFAQEAFPEGHYLHAPVDPSNGEEWAGSTWAGEIRYTRDRRYHSRTPDFPHQNARFRSLGGNVYLAEIPDRDGEGTYSYGLAWLYDGGVITYRAPHCSDLPAEALGELGIEMDVEGLCRIDDLDTLVLAMSAWLDTHQDGTLRFDGIYRLVE